VSPKQSVLLLRSRQTLLGVFCALALVGCGNAPDVKTIAVVNNLESLDPIVISMQKELASAEDIDVEYVYLDRDLPIEDGLAQLLDAEPDLVASLTTPLSLDVGVMSLAVGVPQVFGMVTDPFGSDLVESRESPGRDRTGVELRQVQQAFELTVRATGAERVAVLHNPNDPASVSGLALAETAAAGLDIAILRMVANSDAELDALLSEGPPPHADAFLLVGSPFAARNLTSISAFAETWDIPSTSALTVDFLPTGFTLAIAADSGDIGHLMAERIMAILNGAAAGEIPVAAAKNITLIDLEQVARHGVSLNDEVLVEFDHILGGA
jgi:putative tryptophan/tyrosine transport system substrate-binding protein